MKRVLILGAGLVARPMVTYLLEETDFQVTVASRTVSKAEELVNGHPRGQALPLLAEDQAGLERLVQGHDLVVSLLPYTHHPKIAKLCLQYGKHLVTTSYVGPAMRALHEEAKAKGLLFLNEIGLDPGIDHMSAMRIIDRVREEGGKIVSFQSFCGGLPAPEANDNPFGYKMSWSPRGVALAGRNDACYLENGTTITVPGPALFSQATSFQVPGNGEFEAYPNRDSLPYVGLYGIHGVRTMIRGTLRHSGWCRTWKAIADLGYLQEIAVPADVTTYQELAAYLMKSPGTDLRREMAHFCGIPADSDILDRLEWLGLLSAQPIGKEPSILDALCALLKVKLAYGPSERDMIVLFHKLIAEYPDDTTQVITSTFVDYGIPDGDSAMARTVSLPAAIAVKLILLGQLPLTGVQIPLVREVYEPILNELERRGLASDDQWQARSKVLQPAG